MSNNGNMPDDKLLLQVAKSTTTLADSVRSLAAAIHVLNEQQSGLHARVSELERTKPAVRASFILWVAAGLVGALAGLAVRGLTP